MKNVILTHKELQLNLFIAYTYGLSKKELGDDLIITYEITDTDFIWKVVKRTQDLQITLDGNVVEGKPLFFHHINKGEYRMNDVRLGVTVSYLEEQAIEFLSDFEKYKQGIPKGGTFPTFKFKDLVE